MTIKGCPACLEDVPDDAQFCGACGFRLAPVSRKRPEQLQALLQPAADDAGAVPAQPGVSVEQPLRTGQPAREPHPATDGSG